MIFYNQAINDIDKSIIAPVYLLFGEEYFLVEKIINRIKDQFLLKAEAELNYFVRYVSEEGVDAVITLTSGMGLFSEKKLVVLKEVESIRQGNLERLSKIFLKKLDNICLILHAQVSNLNQSKLKHFEEKVTTVNLLPLQAEQLRQFVSDEFKRYGKEITSKGIELLVFLVGNQMSDLMGQANNISQYYADRKQIDSEEVEKIASVFATQNIFEFNRYVGNRDYEKASFILANLLDSGISPQQIISQLIRHFSLLWKILGYFRVKITDNDTLVKELRIYYKYIDEYKKQSKLWTMSDLNNIFKLLYEADFTLKNISTKPQIVLDMLSYQIINSN
jgi:DNA polymerase-3 subunit delta